MLRRLSSLARSLPGLVLPTLLPAPLRRSSPHRQWLRAASSDVPYHFEPVLQLSAPDVEWEHLTSDHVETIDVGGRTVLKVQPEALTMLTSHAMRNIAHLLRPAHLRQLSNILKDDDASSNDKFVAFELLKNANIAAGMVLPGCQDTGTAIVMGKKGECVWTEGDSDEDAISRGVYDTYTNTNLRYSQMAPLNMYEEVNTKCNLPAQIELFSQKGNEYHFLFIAKGGGSANKSYLYQENKSVLNEATLPTFLEERMRTIGTSACPPYHLAVVIGGMSAEYNLKMVKLASTKYLDTLPTSGNEYGRAFRDLELEEKILEIAQNLGIGAQFGGKYFAHDIRVVRLPRHGASLPIGMGVSCSADRQALGKITKDGVFLEKLEKDPAKYLPDINEDELTSEPVSVSLDQPMADIRKQLSQYPIRTRLQLTGTMIVARDIAHSKMREMLKDGKPLPDYIKDHIVYYAGPAKTPDGYASGSFGPTTAGRMDGYVNEFMQNGGSFISLAKGNRSRQVTRACKKHGGFYLGSIGGPAAALAKNSIKKVEVVDFPELGMEAVCKIQVENFPAFIVVDDKGNDFFADLI